jgi:hypothetical protein
MSEQPMRTALPLLGSPIIQIEPIVDLNCAPAAAATPCATAILQ